MVKTANQKPAVMLGHNAVLHSLHYNGFLLGSMHYASFASEQAHILADNRISTFITVHQSTQRAPCAKITPAKISGNGINAVSGFLHHGIIY